MRAHPGSPTPGQWRLESGEVQKAAGENPTAQPPREGGGPPDTRRVGLGPTRPLNGDTSHLSPRQSDKRVPRNASLPLQPPPFQAFPRARQGTPSPHLLLPLSPPRARGVLWSGCSSSSVRAQSPSRQHPHPPRPPRVCCLLGEGLPTEPQRTVRVPAPTAAAAHPRRTGPRSEQRWEGAPPVGVQMLPVIPGRPLSSLAWGWVGVRGWGSSPQRWGMGQDAGVGCPGWPPTGVRAQGERIPERGEVREQQGCVCWWGRCGARNGGCAGTRRRLRLATRAGSPQRLGAAGAPCPAPCPARVHTCAGG